MLPSALLQSRQQGARIWPRYLMPAQRPWAEQVLAVIAAQHHKRRAEVMAALKALEGDSTDYRLVRGLAHLALEAAEFTLPLAEIEPAALRDRLFAASAERGYGEPQRQQLLQEMASEYRLEPELLPDLLYADLPENHLLTTLPDYSAEALADRYDLAQAQGLLYAAVGLEITAYRNVPGEYRRLFHQLKFNGLLYTIEGCLEEGYRIWVDGPASLFRQTRKYGLKMAAFLPTLLPLTRWRLVAQLERQGKAVEFVLDSDHHLKTPKAKPAAYDSLLEQSFANAFVKLDSPWQLEREVALIDLKGTVFVPDFALRHPDGRCLHVEIVGFWHPDYLRRKLDKIRRAAMPNLLLAVSERLNVGVEALSEVVGPVIFFKERLSPKLVIEIAEQQSTRRLE